MKTIALTARRRKTIRRKRPAAASESPRRVRTAATLARGASVLDALRNLRTVFGSARSHDAEVRRAAGISGSQLWALAQIADQPGISVNALAERLALHQTTASNLVYSLAERELVRRSRDDADRRVIHLHASPDGESLLRRAPGPHVGILVDALGHLQPEQLRQLRHSLAQLVGVMRRAVDDAAGAPLMGE